MTEAPLDPREHPFRADLAASYLQGRVTAARFSDGETMTVRAGVTAVRARPDPGAMRISELLFGERFTAYERSGGWAWGQSLIDGYVGYVAVEALADGVADPDHEVAATRTYAFAEPDLKTEPLVTLHMTTRVRVSDRSGGYARIDGGGWVSEGHLVPVGRYDADPVAVGRRLLGAPYLWGGRSSFGVDCSGFTQLVLARIGRSAPRDSDQQERSVGAVVTTGLESAVAGDLLFMRGHVVMVTGPGMVIHANAHHMAVAEEPLADLLRRLDAMNLPITTIRRP